MDSYENKHLLSYIVRSTSTEALQKLLEMTPSNLKTKRRTLQDILVNVFDRLMAISFSEGLATLLERLNGIWLFDINSSLCCSPEVEVQKVEIWTVSWPQEFSSFCWRLGLVNFQLEILKLHLCNVVECRLASTKVKNELQNGAVWAKLCPVAIWGMKL